MIIRSITTLVFVISIFNAATVQADIVIDRFNTGSTIAQIGAGTSIQTTNSPGILGGSRDSSLTVANLGGSELFGIMGFGSGLQLAQGNSDQIQGSVLYNNFSSIDLTETGANQNFALRILSTDMASPITNAFSITVGSGANTSTVGFDVPSNNDLPSYLIVNFSDFVGVDMTSVDSIELAFDFATNPGAEVTIGVFMATTGIPEPASATLFVCVALFATIRRKR